MDALTPPTAGWLAELAEVDRAVYAAVGASNTPRLDVAMARLSNAANYSRLSICAATLLALTRGDAGRRAAKVGLGSLGATATVANLALKPLGRRERPDRAGLPDPRTRGVRMPRSRSLPSGHTASAFAFATGVSAVLPWEGGALHLLAAAVGYSRVHTGVHYPSDVILGALTGAIVGHVVVPRVSRGSRDRADQAAGPARLSAKPAQS